MNFTESLFKKHQETGDNPHLEEVVSLADGVLEVLFPERSSKRFQFYDEFLHEFNELKVKLKFIFHKLEPRLNKSCEELSDHLFLVLPSIYEELLKDAVAIANNDPAAVDTTEVIKTYPGFYAIAIHRISHELHKMEIPYIPRVLNESAHRKTGIDIHPGAQIGSEFVIDHGTGIVIGESCVIGNRVKIYQNVTLGALSVDKKFASTKRHPTIEDNVIIYSGATILGGDTVIGENTIIGGNVWLTNSVPKNAKVFNTNENVIKESI